MTDRTWVMNASPLIMLGKINRLDLTEGTRRKFPMPPKILHATHQGARNIELTFSDGATGRSRLPQRAQPETSEQT